MGTPLDQIYRAYIGALNDRRLNDLDQFVHPRLTYNGQPWIREQYRARLADDVRAIPDLHYDIELLVVDQDHVASRLRFDCTPQGEFLGVDAGGRRVSFTEHVFYRFRADKIEHVWSLIDTDEIRRQLAERE